MLLNESTQQRRPDTIIVGGARSTDRKALRARLDRSEDERRRLAEERRRVDGLCTDLASARTAAMISGADTAALRTQLELLT